MSEMKEKEREIWRAWTIASILVSGIGHCDWSVERIRRFCVFSLEYDQIVYPSLNLNPFKIQWKINKTSIGKETETYEVIFQAMWRIETSLLTSMDGSKKSSSYLPTYLPTYLIRNLTLPRAGLCQSHRHNS